MAAGPLSSHLISSRSLSLSGFVCLIRLHIHSQDPEGGDLCLRTSSPSDLIKIVAVERWHHQQLGAQDGTKEK
ncbi:hypothetical protein CMV_030490 [Castanea mollissima]|uniref:Uncharacterized protein n=1 Tax=Castanea mollissima TaxID=60419 RepID=A0A8J4UY66_9ROSI|nr:hypothetical protein CMV_030490 [Castanea mollissima]